MGLNNIPSNQVAGSRLATVQPQFYGHHQERNLGLDVQLKTSFM